MIRAALLSLAIATLSLSLSMPATAQDTSQPDFVYSEAPNDRSVGAENAPHTLILYASNMCPHCGTWFANDWPTIKRDLVETGQLRLVFRPLPSQPIQLSAMGFLMAECAPAEDYMMVMEDQFARQNTILEKIYSQSGDLKADFDAIARMAGLETDEEIATCLNNQANSQRLQLASDRAGAAGITGIPSFIFDGNVMSGKHDAAAIMGWIEGRSTSTR